MIVVNWNGRHLLDDCLGALRRQTFRSFETIFVDNGSCDGSAQYVRTYFPEVQLLTLNENCGFTGGNIAGYEIASGNLIALLNNDTEAHPRWLEAMHEASLLYPRAGSFASKMLYFDCRDRIENCGFELGMGGTTLERGRDEWDDGRWDKVSSIFGACGGAAIYRREMLNDIGFLDPDFFAIYEDVDLSFRAQLHGYACVYVPDAVVFHRYRSTLRGRTPTQVFYSQRNIEFVYFKNMPIGLILRSMPHRLAYEFGAAAHFINERQGWAFLVAKLSVLRHFRRLWRKRHEIQQMRTVGSPQICNLMRPVFSAKWKKLRRSFAQSF